MWSASGKDRLFFEPLTLPPLLVGWRTISRQDWTTDWTAGEDSLYSASHRNHRVRRSWLLTKSMPRSFQLDAGSERSEPTFVTAVESQNLWPITNAGIHHTLFIGGRYTVVSTYVGPSATLLNEVAPLLACSGARFVDIPTGRYTTNQCLTARARGVIIMSSWPSMRHHDVQIDSIGLLLCDRELVNLVAGYSRALIPTVKFGRRNQRAGEFMLIIDHFGNELTRAAYRGGLTGQAFGEQIHGITTQLFTDVAERCGIDTGNVKVDDLVERMLDNHKLLPAACEQLLDAHPELQPFYPGPSRQTVRPFELTSPSLLT